jgi:hypothetical protein
VSNFYTSQLCQNTLNLPRNSAATAAAAIAAATATTAAATAATATAPAAQRYKNTEPLSNHRVQNAGHTTPEVLYLVQYLALIVRIIIYFYNNIILV